MTDTRICTEQDQYILDWLEWKARWVVTLSNGLTVYQDDGRYSVDGSSDNAWLRLKNYCLLEKVYPLNVKFQFRQNEMNFPNHRSYLLTLGSGGEIYSGITHSYLIIGYPQFNSSNFIQTWVKCPEMSMTRTEVLSEEEIKSGPFKDALIECNIPVQVY